MKSCMFFKGVVVGACAVYFLQDKELKDRLAKKLDDLSTKIVTLKEFDIKSK